MLNCSEVNCILHLEHYLQHHLQDHRQHHVMSGEPEESSDGTLKANTNNTDAGYPPNLAHLEAPSESVYMIGGVLIAMALVALIIVLLAVTISKLRKRDESHSPPQEVVLQTTAVNNNHHPPPPQPPGTPVVQSAASILQQPPQPESCGGTGTTTIYPPVQFLWQYPPHYPVYSNDQDAHVHALPSERPGIVRSFRKNVRGRWRRLVKRKPVTEVYTIPEDLRDQLKQIYVY